MSASLSFVQDSAAGGMRHFCLMAMLTCASVVALSRFSNTTLVENHLRQQFSQLALSGNMSLGKSLFEDVYLETIIAEIMQKMPANIPVDRSDIAGRRLSKTAKTLKEDILQTNQDICFSFSNYSSVSDPLEYCSGDVLLNKMASWRAYISRSNGPSHSLTNIVLQFLNYSENFENDKAYRKIAAIRKDIRTACQPSNAHWQQTHQAIVNILGNQEKSSGAASECNLSRSNECRLSKSLIACFTFHSNLLRPAALICNSHIANLSDVELSTLAATLSRLTESAKQLLADIEISGIPACTPSAVCQTDECKDLAKLLLLQINSSANPCHDFYAYACGGLESRHPLSLAEMEAALRGELPSDLAEEKPGIILENRIKAAVLQELTHVDIRNESTPEPIRHAKRFYELCLNYRERNSRAMRMTDVANVVSAFAEWPFLNKNSTLLRLEDKAKIYKLLGKLVGSLSIAPLLELDFIVPNGTVHLFTIKPAEFGTGQNFSIDDVYLHRVENVKKSLRILAAAQSNFSASETSINVTAHKVVRMEKRLAAFAGLNAKPGFLLLDVLYQKKSLLWPFIASAFRNESIARSFLGKNTSIVVFQSSQFLARVSKLLNDKLNKRTLLHLIMVRMLEKLAFIFDEDLSDPFMEYRATAERPGYFKNTFRPGDTEASPDDEDKCLKETINHFEAAIDRLYVDKHFEPEKQAKTAEMVREIMMATNLAFLQSDIFKLNKTRNRFLRKLGKMVTHIGFPEKLLDDAVLNRWSSKRVMANADYFATALDFMKWDYAKIISDGSNALEDHCAPAISAGNACYLPGTNSLTIPAATMDQPFYDASYPLAFQYGLVGSVIGHEIFHGFDAFNGVTSDENGKELKDKTLFSSSLEDEEFVDRCNCLRKDANAHFCYELGEYTLKPLLDEDVDETENVTQRMLRSEDVAESIPWERERRDLMLPPDAEDIEENKSCVRYQHLGETMSDLDGLKVAFKALRLHQHSSPKESDLKLPGLEKLTAEQLFYVAHATFYCEPYNPLKLAIQLERHYHPPNEARVNLAVRHSLEFAKAFGCKSGDRLKPSDAEVCQIY